MSVLRAGRTRWATGALAALLAALALGACTVPPPPGDAPLRYRDQVFPSYTLTSDLT